MSTVRSAIQLALHIAICVSTLAIAAWLGGCAAPPAQSAHADDPLSAVPDDLTVDLRVLVAQHPPGSEKPQAVTPARFVLLADGMLHAELNGPHEQRELPALVRRLDRKQLAELWSLLHQTGFAQQDSDQSIANPMLIKRPSEGTIYILSIRAHDRWTQIQRTAGDAPQSAPAMARLADRLAELSWLTDQAQQAALVAPPRYDFGPDPYARYRKNK